MAAEASGEQAEDLAATMLASTLGLDLIPRPRGTSANRSTNTAA